MVAEKHQRSDSTKESTLNANVGAADSTMTLQDGSTFPGGGAAGKVVCTIDPDLPSEERIRYTSRTGNTLNVVERGYGQGGTGQAHSAGATVRHSWSAVEASEAHDHVVDTTLDQHSQYLNTTRHAAVVHTAGMLGTDSVTADKILAGAVGSAELGAGAVIAGKIAAGGVSAASQLAAGVVDAAAILDGAVGTAEIATDAVTADEILAGTVGSAELAASAVIAGKVAAGGVSATNQIADAIITLAKFASEAGTTYASGNPFNNVTLGTGGVSFGRHFKLGRFVLVLAGFQLGTGGNVTGVIELSLPFTAANISAFTGSDASTGGFAACRAFDPGGGNVRQSGTGVTSTNTCTNFATAGVNATWDANTPWDWNAEDKFQCVIVYEATA